MELRASMAAVKQPTCAGGAACLASLPDDAILLVFAKLENADKVSLFYRPCDASNLAAAHPRFGRLHRLFVVRRLQISVEFRTDAEEQALAQKVQRQLRRYPRAENMRIWFPRWTRRRIEPFVSSQLRYVEIVDVGLNWGIIRGLLRACPGLVQLGLMKCSWGSGVEDARKRYEDAECQSWSLEFQTWSRLQSLRLMKSTPVLSGLVRNGALFELHALRELDVSGCEYLNGSQFDAIARLSKMTTLSVRATAFTCADAARILPRLPLLKELVVSQCRAITSALWVGLPPTLLVLRASGTRLFQVTNGVGVAGGCGGVGGSLRVLDADFSGLESWRALTSGFGELRELYIAYSEKLGDEPVEAALAAMPKLEKLNLRGCARVGNRTAVAIARHCKLSHIWVELTAISNAGIVELSSSFPQVHPFRRQGRALVRRI